MRYKVSGAFAASWEAKAGVKPPFAEWERLFSLRIILIAGRCAPALPHYTQVVSREEHLFFKKLADTGKIGTSFDISVGLCYNKMTHMSERRMGHFAKIEEALHLTGKTHLTVGTAATILITQPSDWKSFLLCMGAAAVGSCVSDIDVSTSGSHKGLQRILILIGLAIIVVSVLDGIFHAGIWTMIQQKNGLLQSLAGFAMFIAICIYGERQPHRTFTHSLAGVATLGLAVFIMLPEAVWYFICGMGTHIVLDLFNCKKIQLLFPFERGKICFYLCKAGGKVNQSLFWVGLVLWILEILWMAATWVMEHGWQ